MSVVQNGSGELIISRRNPKEKRFDYKEYGPCPQCFLWLKLKDMPRHVGKRCLVLKLSEEAESEIRVRSARTMAESLRDPHTQFGSQRLREEVFPNMSNSPETLIAKGDPHICQLGDEWYSKSERNHLRRRNYDLIICLAVHDCS